MRHTIAGNLRPLQMINQRRDARRAKSIVPNPLSMFTTLTFGEQVFSIPSNAAIPPSDAP